MSVFFKFISIVFSQAVGRDHLAKWSEFTLSFHEDFIRNEKIKSSSNRSFGLVMTVFFLVLGTLWGLRYEFLIVAFGFLASALIKPDFLKPLNQVWTRFGVLLHKITSPLILALMFFAVFLPFGLIMRIFNQRPLKMKPDRNAKSYWIDSKSGHFSQQF